MTIPLQTHYNPIAPLWAKRAWGHGEGKGDPNFAAPDRNWCFEGVQRDVHWEKPEVMVQESFQERYEEKRVQNNMHWYLPYQTISYHTISCHIMSYHIISYHTISYHMLPYHIISYHIMSYHIISYHIIPYHIICYHTISYHTISYHTISFHIILYHIIPYHIV